MSTAWDHPQLTKHCVVTANQPREPAHGQSKGDSQRDSEVPSPNATFLLQDPSSQPLLLFLLYHNALGLAFTLLKEHEYIIIHTKEQVIVYELPAFPATKAIFIRKLNFILAPI